MKNKSKANKHKGNIMIIALYLLMTITTLTWFIAGLEEFLHII